MLPVVAEEHGKPVLCAPANQPAYNARGGGPLYIRWLLSQCQYRAFDYNRRPVQFRQPLYTPLEPCSPQRHAAPTVGVTLALDGDSGFHTDDAVVAGLQRLAHRSEAE